jgi:hypothetical protein
MKLSLCPFHQPGLGCDYYATVLVGVKPAIVAEETTEVLVSWHTGGQLWRW